MTHPNDQHRKNTALETHSFCFKKSSIQTKYSSRHMLLIFIIAILFWIKLLQIVLFLAKLPGGSILPRSESLSVTQFVKVQSAVPVICRASNGNRPHFRKPGGVDQSLQPIGCGHPFLQGALPSCPPTFLKTIQRTWKFGQLHTRSALENPGLYHNL